MINIKFRAWDKTTKEMITVLDLKYSHDPMCYLKYIGAGTQCLHPAQDYELMQFTGLSDKNGKEIYEGDIVETTSDMTDEKRRWAIKFDAGEWCMFSVKNIVAESLYFTGEKYITIIGNIYENPELLERK